MTVNDAPKPPYQNKKRYTCKATGRVSGLMNVQVTLDIYTNDTIHQVTEQFNDTLLSMGMYGVHKLNIERT